MLNFPNAGALPEGTTFTHMPSDQEGLIRGYTVEGNRITILLKHYQARLKFGPRMVTAVVGLRSIHWE